MKKINIIYLRSKISSDSTIFLKQRELYLEQIKKEYEICDEGVPYFFIESGGVEEQFKIIYEKYKEPYNLIATNGNNSLPAALEIVSFLKNQNLKYNLFHAKSEDITNILKNNTHINENDNYKLFCKDKYLINKTYGIIGKPSDWLISSDVNYSEVYKKLGIKLIDISIDEFKKEIDEAKDIIDPIIFENKLNEKLSESTLKTALKIYSALFSIIKRYHLNGLTVRCFDLLKMYQNTSCLALALLNSQGYIASCEGDIPTLISMALINEKFYQSSFQVNPSYINIDERYGYFAHCTIPLDMCLSYKFDTHFESGLGIGIKGELNLGNVTIFKMNSLLDKFEVFEGKIIQNSKFKNLCRTQIKVAFCEDISSLVNSPCGNHLLIFKGHHKKEILHLLAK